MMLWTTLLFACSGEAETIAPPPAPVAEAPKAASPAEKAAAIAKAIDANPAEAEAILKKHSMTEAEYRALLYTIAEDSAQSKVFLENR